VTATSSGELVLPLYGQIRRQRRFDQFPFFVLIHIKLDRYPILQDSLSTLEELLSSGFFSSSLSVSKTQIALFGGRTPASYSSFADFGDSSTSALSHSLLLPIGYLFGFFLLIFLTEQGT